MIKVLHVCKTFNEGEGGVERFVDILCFALNKQGVQSSVATTASQSQPSVVRMANQTIFYFPRNLTIASCPISFSFLKDFAKLAADHDVIHYHFPWPWADAAALVKANRKPSIVTYHSDIIRQRLFMPFYRPLMRRFLRRADRIVATSDNLRQTSPVLRHYQNKTSVIPLGLNREQYPKPDPARLDQWREKFREWGIGEGEPFLAVGALRYYKGLEFLLEAVRGTNLKLLIAGSGAFGSRLKKFCADRGIANARFLGHVSEEDKICLIKLSRAVVSSSHLRSEAFCISLLEGLMFEKPLISTELGTGTSFVNRHGLTGLVVPPADARALRDAMYKLASDENLYQQFKENTRVHFETHFRADKITESYVQIYKQLLADQK
jgi:rhamnosyl/mannosyltransferase